MDVSAKLNFSYPAITPSVTPAVTTSVDRTVDPAVVTPVAKTTTDSDTSSTDEQTHADPEKLKAAVQEIEKFVQSVKRNLEFSIDEASGKVIVKVIASETGEVIRQLPSAEALKIADSLHNANSLLFDAKV